MFTLNTASMPLATCDLDLSVEWFKLLFRNIKLTVVGIA